MGLFGSILSIFGGANSAETNAARNVSSTANYLGQLGAANAQRQSAGFNEINSILDPILSAGPNQMGFSPEYTAALETSALNSTAGNFANAERSVGTKLAGEGGGTFTGPKSGVAGQIEGSLAGEAAGQLSGEQLGITKANWEQGTRNFENALGEKNNLLQLENPTPQLNAAMSGNQSSFSDQQAIQKQNAGALGSIIGLGESLLPHIQSGAENLDTTGSSNPLEQIGNFFSGFGGGSTPSGPGG
jgi:hypothetical protein